MRCLSRVAVHYALDLFHEAALSLRTLGKRSLLALMGIAMGSASVVALLNIGSNAATEAEAVFKGMGVDTLLAQFSEAPAVGDFDSEHLHAQVPALRSVAPLAQGFAAVVFRGRTFDASLVGSTAWLADIIGFSLREGRFLSMFDQRATFAVVGHQLALELAAEGEPLQIGDQLRINDYLYQVLGILHDHPDGLLVPIRPNSSLFIPIQGMRRIDSRSAPRDVVMRAHAVKDMSNLALRVRDVLQQAHPTQQINIAIAQQIIDGMSRQARLFSYLLMALASVSLAAGGVGVMNVMVMNIAQRKREIGVRMALGARRRDIRNLFLLEAFALSAAGALLGALFGGGFSWAYAVLSGWTFAFAGSSLLLGVGSTLLVGVFFGLHPAMAASRLRPVEALREV